MNKGLYGFPSNDNLLGTFPLSKTVIDTPTYGYDYRYPIDQAANFVPGALQYAKVEKLNTGVPFPKNWTLVVPFRWTTLPTVGIDTALYGLFSTYSGSNYLNIHAGKATVGDKIDFSIFHGNAIGGAAGISSMVFNVPLNKDVCTVFFVHENDRLRTYFNAVYHTDYSMPSSQCPSTFYTTEVGRVYGIDGRILPGVMAHIRLFDFVLTVDQMEKFWNGGKFSNALDKLDHMLWLPFNSEGTDFSGNFRNATLMNSLKFTQFYLP